MLYGLVLLHFQTDASSKKSCMIYHDPYTLTPCDWPSIQLAFHISLFPVNLYLLNSCTLIAILFQQNIISVIYVTHTKYHMDKQKLLRVIKK